MREPSMRLLVGYDGFARRDPLPREIAFVARAFGAELALFHAVPPLHARRQLEAQLMDERRQALERLARGVRGIRTTVGIGVGAPEDAILRAAAEREAGLVALLANPRKFSDKRGGFGTTALGLLRECPTAVWAVRPRARARPLHVMAAVDVDSDDSVLAALSGRILEVALAFASHPGARLCVLHAWSLWGEGLLRGFGRASPLEMAHILRQEEQAHRRDLSRLLARHDFSAVDTRVEVVEGDPARSIADAASRLGVDTLVMGMSERAGLRRLARGNAAERLLNRVDASVVVVKAPGDGSGSGSGLGTV